MEYLKEHEPLLGVPFTVKETIAVEGEFSRYIRYRYTDIDVKIKRFIVTYVGEL